MRIVAIDFEASCLPRHGRSYPIEVGISEDGITARSWLIRPAACWAGWDWTDEAERLHGLSRERILREGQPVGEVARALAEAIGDAMPVADNVLDNAWMRTLCRAAAIPAFARVRPVSELFEQQGLVSGTILDAVARVDRLGLGRHRAGDDARWLAALLAELGVIAAAERPLFDWRQACGEGQRLAGVEAAAEGVQHAQQLTPRLMGGLQIQLVP